MVLFFDCTDSLIFYKCIRCDFWTNEKIGHLFHTCDSESEVRNIKQLCSKCTIISYSILWIFAHQMNHEKTRNKRTNTLNKLKTSAKKLLCDHCAACFTTDRTLKIHFNAKHESDEKVIWYKCEKCEWKSKYLRSLQCHKNNKHSARNKNYQCNQCQYQTYQEIFLKRHIIQRHTPDDLIPWQICTLCSYRAKQKSALNQHIRGVHTPNNQFLWIKCNKCDYKTKRQYHLKNHLLNMHSEEGASRRFRCSDCAFQTNSQFHLKEHLISRHTPDHLIHWFNCNICVFKTKMPQNLKKHTRLMHAPGDQVNRFECQKCNATFKLKRSLKRHTVQYHSTEISSCDC